MTLDLADHDRKTKAAVKAFWRSRAKAKQKQVEAGNTDRGERAGVTGGVNMDGFVALAIDVVKANGLTRAEIHRKRAVLTLPGYFRPTKLWDLLVTHERQLIAAIEFKSQVGPSFGNNFNNRVEEAIGTAHDLWTAYREDAFGNHPKPFVGWVMLVEDAQKSRQAVRDQSPHFSVFKEFEGASYQRRYEILCQRLAKEQLYTAAALVTSPRTAEKTGEHAALSEMTSFKTLIASLAGHVAAHAAGHSK